MFTLCRRALLCLLLLWLPVSWAAESDWLTSPDNSHAAVRVRADINASNETRLLLDIKLSDGWKTYWRSPGEGCCASDTLAGNSGSGAMALASSGAL